MTLDINKFDIAKFKVLNKLNFYIVFILSMSLLYIVVIKILWV